MKTRASHGEAGQLVQPPRVTDAIGRALHRAFSGNGVVPEDMQTVLEQLDRAVTGLG